MVQEVIGLVLKQTLCSGCCWASVKRFSDFPATKGVLKTADRNNKKAELLQWGSLSRWTMNTWREIIPFPSCPWADPTPSSSSRALGWAKGKGSSSGRRDAPHTAQTTPEYTFLSVPKLPNPFPVHQTLSTGTEGRPQWLLTPHKGISDFRSLGSKNIPHIINSTKHSWTPPLCCPEGQLGTKPAQHQVLHKPILRLIHTSSRTAKWKENSHFVQLHLCPDSKTHFPEVKWKGINSSDKKAWPGKQP